MTYKPSLYSRYSGSIDAIFMALITVLIVALLFGSCTRGFLVSPDRAVEATEDMGFTDVVVEDKDVVVVGWRGCDEKDAAGFDVVATNAQGQNVSVKVCCGLLKGCTVRSK